MSFNINTNTSNELCSQKLGHKKLVKKMSGKLPKLLVNVKVVPGDEPLQVYVKRFAKVRSIKKKVKKVTGIPINQQTLILSGKQLDFSERLSSLVGPDEKELTVFLLVNKQQVPLKKKQGSEKNVEEASLTKKDEVKQETTEVESDWEELSVLETEPREIQGVVPQVQTIGTEIPFAKADSPVLKLSFEGQHRRVQFEGNSYCQLTNLCTSFFGIRNPNRMVICYRDEDGDLVQVSSDAELAYALRHYATKQNSESSELPVLRLSFSVKPIKKPFQEVGTTTTTIPRGSEASVRKLQEGDVIELSTKEGLKLVLSGEKQVVAIKDDASFAGHWIVEKPQELENHKKSESGDHVCRRKEQQVIFLKNKKAFKNKHLMATADGKLLHNGGNGKWARFVVEYPPVDDGKTQIKLRAVGRSQVRGGQNSFVGVVEKEGQQVPCGSVVSDDQSANLTVNFV